MNIFDEHYEFRFAAVQDIPSIMEFINTQWKQGHILATDRALFEYEFLDGERVNFLLAINRDTGCIQGIQGFLKMEPQTEGKGIWSCLWKVRDQGSLPLLGVELSKRVERMTKCAYRIGPGSNPVTAIPIYRAVMHKFTARMEQYYMLNPDREYKIARIVHRENGNPERSAGRTLRLFRDSREMEDSFSFADYPDARPYKGAWYYDRRFFRHPVYAYSVYGICRENGPASALLVMRKVTQGDSSVLRIVDYFGEQQALGRAGKALLDILQEEGCEYLDFYCYGIAEESLKQAGFIKRLEKDTNILPNYFEPFVQENVDIWFHSSIPDVVVCKADGDQDRPSIRRDRTAE